MTRPGTNLGRPNNNAFGGNTNNLGSNNLGNNNRGNNVGGFAGGPPAPGTNLGNNVNGGFMGNPPPQPGNNLGQPGGLAGNPPANNNLGNNGFAGNNGFGGQANNNLGQPGNNFGQPNGFAGQPNNNIGNRPPDFDPWAANPQAKQDLDNAGRKATGGMIAMGIMSLLVGLAILGCLGWLVFQNNAHSAPVSGGGSRRQAPRLTAGFRT